MYDKVKIRPRKNIFFTAKTSVRQHKMTKRVLNTVVFMGSSRDIVPHWGGDSRLSNRVLAYVKNAIANRETKLGGETISHKVTVFDPLRVFGDGGALFKSLAALKTPHHFFKEGEAPVAMTTMQQAIKAADCYVVISCEYNYPVPPGITGMMSCFGAANYANKPAAIICYSPGPFGGARAATELRPFLSMLGCISASKLTLLANPEGFLEPDGAVKDPAHGMLLQLPAQLGELEWLAVAMRAQKDRSGPVDLANDGD
jgi:chromate reductase, NAD(P)H dehydrogenase (quinone)